MPSSTTRSRLSSSINKRPAPPMGSRCKLIRAQTRVPTAQSRCEMWQRGCSRAPSKRSCYSCRKPSLKKTLATPSPRAASKQSKLWRASTCSRPSCTPSTTKVLSARLRPASSYSATSRTRPRLMWPSKLRWNAKGGSSTRRTIFREYSAAFWRHRTGSTPC